MSVSTNETTGDKMNDIKKTGQCITPAGIHKYNDDRCLRCGRKVLKVGFYVMYTETGNGGTVEAVYPSGQIDVRMDTGVKVGTWAEKFEIHPGVKVASLEIGDAVKVTYTFQDEEYEYYGHVTSAKPALADSEFTKKFRKTFTGVHVRDQEGFVQRIMATDIVQRCTGCECGNPFTLCHPDA